MRTIALLCHDTSFHPRSSAMAITRFGGFFAAHAHSLSITKNRPPRGKGWRPRNERRIPVTLGLSAYRTRTVSAE